jgi:hypothetical protein
MYRAPVGGEDDLARGSNLDLAGELRGLVDVDVADDFSRIQPPPRGRGRSSAETRSAVSSK